MLRLSNSVAVIALAALTSPFAISNSQAAPDAKKPGRIWTDPAKAESEDSDFKIQGEYTGDGAGVQVTALGGGKFYLSKFAGGLPGAGWDRSAPAVQQTDTAGVTKITGSGMKKVARSSPTLDAKPPEGAAILFGGEANDLVKGEVKDGHLWAGAQSTGEFGSFKMHLEFRLPYKPDTPPSSQDRGNSGIYIQNRYEVQVLDSFGLVYDRDQIELPLKSDPKQWCGCLYKFKTADTPMCLPPLTWQTYDIDFTAPKFDGNKKVANARLTVVQNGVKIHDDVELPKGTGMGGTRKEVAKGPIIFQGHGNPIAYRNVWIVPATK